jgi:hypothetical protein
MLSPSQIVLSSFYEQRGHALTAAFSCFRSARNMVRAARTQMLTRCCYGEAHLELWPIFEIPDKHAAALDGLASEGVGQFGQVCGLGSRKKYFRNLVNT